MAGEGNTIIAGKFAFAVHGVLELSNLTITGASFSSAIVVSIDTPSRGVRLELEPSLLLEHVVMQNNGYVTAKMQGAALQIGSGGRCNASMSKFLNNAAGGGKPGPPAHPSVYLHFLSSIHLVGGSVHPSVRPAACLPACLPARDARTHERTNACM